MRAETTTNGKRTFKARQGKGQHSGISSINVSSRESEPIAVEECFRATRLGESAVRSIENALEVDFWT